MGKPRINARVLSKEFELDFWALTQIAYSDQLAETGPCCMNVGNQRRCVDIANRHDTPAGEPNLHRRVLRLRMRIQHDAPGSQRAMHLVQDVHDVPRRQASYGAREQRNIEGSHLKL